MFTLKAVAVFSYKLWRAFGVGESRILKEKSDGEER